MEPKSKNEFVRVAKARHGVLITPLKGSRGTTSDLLNKELWQTRSLERAPQTNNAKKAIFAPQTTVWSPEITIAAPLLVPAESKTCFTF